MTAPSPVAEALAQSLLQLHADSAIDLDTWETASAVARDGDRTPGALITLAHELLQMHQEEALDLDMWAEAAEFAMEWAGVGPVFVAPDGDVWFMDEDDIDGDSRFVTAYDRNGESSPFLRSLFTAGLTGLAG